MLQRIGLELVGVDEDQLPNGLVPKGHGDEVVDASGQDLPIVALKPRGGFWVHLPLCQSLQKEYEVEAAPVMEEDQEAIGLLHAAVTGLASRAPVAPRQMAVVHAEVFQGPAGVAAIGLLTTEALPHLGVSRRALSGWNL